MQSRHPRSTGGHGRVRNSEIPRKRAKNLNQLSGGLEVNQSSVETQGALTQENSRILLISTASFMVFSLPRVPLPMSSLSRGLGKSSPRSSYQRRRLGLSPKELCHLTCLLAYLYFTCSGTCPPWQNRSRAPVSPLLPAACR